MRFHNPYHFVPVMSGDRVDDMPTSELESATSAGKRHSFVTHDRYAANTNSGRIVCKVTTETPLVIGANQIADQSKRESTIVETFELSGWPAIPASTIRGLLSSIIEAASNSSLRVLEKGSYSYRKEAKSPLKRIGMIMEKAPGQFEMVRLAVFDNQRRSWSNARMVRLPAGHGFVSFSLANPQYYYCWDGQGQPSGEEIVTEAEWSRLSRNVQQDYVKGILRIMENSERTDEFQGIGRVKEVFLLWDPQKDGSFATKKDNLRIEESAIRDFYEIADERTAASDGTLPYEPVGTLRNPDSTDKRIRLKSGDLVYYATSGSGPNETVTEISFSAIWRGKVDDTIDDFFRKNGKAELIPFNTDRTVITIAEQMFGFVEASGKNGKSPSLALSGRVYPSNAIFAGIQATGGTVTKPKEVSECFDLDSSDRDGFTVLKALSAPKPPAPAMYFRPKQGDAFIAKPALSASTCEPQGRKFYLHQKDGQNRPWKTRETQEKANLKMKVKPVTTGAVFYFHVDFVNLSENELNALLYGLRPTEDFRHKIGLGKPLGLGSIRIDPLGLFLTNRTDRYSADKFSGPRYSNAWISDAQGVGEIPVEYELERLANASLSSDHLRDRLSSWRATADKEILSALETLGDPAKTAETPIHYPSSQGDSEREHFRWFVSNERGAKQALRTVSNGVIPTLT